jgi:hypothetical protein
VAGAKAPTRYTLKSLRSWCVVLAITCASTTVITQDSGALDQRINALLFGEIDYREREDLGDDGFAISQAVGQFTFTLDDKLSVFSELTAMAR